MTGTLTIGLLFAAKAMALPQTGGATMDGAGVGPPVVQRPGRLQPRPCHFILMAARGERDMAGRTRRPTQAQPPCYRLMSL